MRAEGLEQGGGGLDPHEQLDAHGWTGGAACAAAPAGAVPTAAPELDAQRGDTPWVRSRVT